MRCLFGHELIRLRDPSGLLLMACTRCTHTEPLIARSDAERLRVLSGTGVDLPRLNVPAPKKTKKKSADIYVMPKRGSR